MNQEVAIYRKHMNLKLAAEELGIAWQSLYVRLKKLGEPVVGDKSRYGSDKDKLAVMAEEKFQQLVPFAMNQNKVSWQSKVDFEVCGHLVDVKAALPGRGNKLHKALSWAFAFKKQTMVCDFVCCFCLSQEKEIRRVLLVPKEFFVGLQTVRVSCDGKSKWLDYEIPANELSKFFSDLGQANKGK